HNNTNCPGVRLVPSQVKVLILSQGLPRGRLQGRRPRPTRMACSAHAQPRTRRRLRDAERRDPRRAPGSSPSTFATHTAELILGEALEHVEVLRVELRVRTAGADH